MNRSTLMSRIRSKNTKPELEYKASHPTATDHPAFPYHPDFIFKDGRIFNVVFIDSGFWHGMVPKKRFEQMPLYWRLKLYRNIVTDLTANTFYQTVADCAGNVKLSRVGHKTWVDILAV